MPRRCYQQGFSLVEMTIVIAIIGLLIGGIAGTRAFLKGAEYTTEINQAKFYITAFNQFVNKYQYPPGDYYAGTAGTDASQQANSTWATSYNGDGNGLIRAHTSTAHKHELFLAFQHLSLAGMIDGTFSGASSDGSNSNTYATLGGSGTAPNVPRLSIPNTSLFYDHPDTLDGNVSSDSLYFDGLYNHVVRLAGMTNNAMPSTAFMTPGAALQLDAKFDDGIPNKGWILTPNTTALSSCTSGGAYNASGTEADACYFILRIQ